MVYGILVYVYVYVCVYVYVYCILYIVYCVWYMVYGICICKCRYTWKTKSSNSTPETSQMDVGQ